MEIVREKACSRCGGPFRCGPGAGQGLGCWCEDLPPLETLIDAGCLCPTYLGAEIARQHWTPDSST